MKLDYEISDFTLRNLLGQINDVFGPDNKSITYSVMDANGNVGTVDVDSWKKIKSEVRTDLAPITDINNVLLGYISFVDNIATVDGVLTVDMLADDKVLLGNDTRGIATKNQYGNIVKSIDESIVDGALLTLLKNGENIIFGNGLPNNSDGLENTIYVDADSMNLLYKNNGSWNSLRKVISKTETPTITGTGGDMTEMTTRTFTISNFNANKVYGLHANSGTVSLNTTNGVITYDAGVVDATIAVTIEVVATEEGLLRSDVATITFNVNNVPTVSDDVIIDNNFGANADASNSIQF